MELPIQGKKKKSGGFQSFGLSLPVFRGVLAMGYKVPTPIQRKAIPAILAGTDVVAMARTGSGKTAAFLIPMFEKLKEHSSKVGSRAVILSPTRELAMQTMKFAKAMSKFSTIKCALIVGGDSMEQQFEVIASNPDCIIGTPGRLMHHLQEIPNFTLKSTEYLVFDEADRMFEMGFAEQLAEITKSMSTNKQTVLFSATLPKALAQFARAGLQDPQLMRLDLEQKISENLKLAFFTLHSNEKPAAFLYMIREVIPATQQTIVFAATRHHVEFLHELLNGSGIESSCIYGDMDQTARKINVGKFRAKKTSVLIVTDVAARGIDIPLLDNVLNYSFPPTAKLFVHRVGRAARAGRSGTAFNFVDSEEAPYMVDLHLYLGRKLEDSTITPSKSPISYNVHSMRVDDVHIGTFPRRLLDQEVEHFRELVARNPPISPLVKVCANAYKQYCRTRSDPSRQSITRAKALNLTCIHPLLVSSLGTDEMVQKTYVDQLQKFRPSNTIFEVSTGTKSLKKSDPTVVMMKNKRKLHESVIKPDVTSQEEESEHEMNDSRVSHPSHHALEKQGMSLDQPSGESGSKKRKLSKAERKALKKGIAWSPKAANDADTKKTNHKDTEHYIDYIKKEEVDLERALSNQDIGKMNSFAKLRLEEAVFDVNPDESNAMRDQKRIMHWDARKKKYIKRTIKDLQGAGPTRRNESGAKIKDAKIGSIYKKWVQRSNRSIGLNGEEDNASPALDYRNGKKHVLNQNAMLSNHKSTPTTASKSTARPVANELLDEHHIRKEERRKDRSRKQKNVPLKKKKSMRNRGNVAGKSHGAPARSKAIIRR